MHIAQPGPDRRDAPCPHYELCGGCTIEHLNYPAQLRVKQELVREALRRIGGIDAPTPDITGSPHEFQYRSRVAFTLRRLPGKSVVAGFHALGRADTVIDITESCLLPEPALATVWGALRRAWGADAARLPSGTELRLTLRATVDGTASLLVDGGFGSGQPEVLLQLVPQLASIWHRARPEDTPVLLAGREYLEERWSGEKVRVGGALFLQVNRETAALLEDYVLQLAALQPEMRIVDAYCGVGLHARRFAAAGARVTGIELDPHAAAEAERAGVRTLTDTVEHALPEVLPADLVVLNPPRGGIDQQVVDALLQSPPARIIYISCDPATLARDIARLRDRYTLQAIRCFDLFPQTTHVETVVELTCSIM
jgi:23S rRNA (uracil1939-C5)-methyltransferase